MARVLLTTDQKEVLRSYERFRAQVKGAILDKARYWMANDGSNPPGGRPRWRKSQTLSAVIERNPSSVDTQNNVDRFLVYCKNIPCVNDQIAEFDKDDTINYLLNDGAQQPVNQFDALADIWFDSEILTTP